MKRTNTYDCKHKYEMGKVLPGKANCIKCGLLKTTIEAETNTKCPCGAEAEVLRPTIELDKRQLCRDCFEKEKGWGQYYKPVEQEVPEVIELVERIVIDFANLTGRETESRAEFRALVYKHLVDFVSEREDGKWEEVYDKQIQERILNEDNPQYVLGWNACRYLSKQFIKDFLMEKRLGSEGVISPS